MDTDADIWESEHASSRVGYTNLFMRLLKLDHNPVEDDRLLYQEVRSGSYPIQ